MNAEAGPRIDLSEDAEGREATIMVEGALVGEQAAQELKRVAPRSGVGLTVDLERCSEIDSHGVSGLASLAASSRSGPLRIVGAHEQVRRELLLAGVRQSELFELKD